MADGTGAAIGLGTSVIDIYQSGQAAKDQAELISEGLTSATEAQQDLYEQGLGLTEPFRSLGLGAVPEFRKIIEKEGMLPSSKLRLKEGLTALKRRQAASGKLRSGETAKDVSTITESVVTGDVNERLRRLLGAANIGTTLATQGAQLATQTGTNIGNIYMGSASSMADVVGAQSQAVSSALGTASQGLQTFYSNRRLQSNTDDRAIV